MNLRAALNPEPGRFGPLALFLVRVATGLVVFPHGYFKVMGGVAGLSAGLASKGVPAAPLFAWCATLAEFVGGLLMVLGLLTRPAAASVAFTLFVAWSTMHLGDLPNIGAKGGASFEYPFLLSITALAIALAGPGRYSLDAIVFKRGRSSR